MTSSVNTPSAADILEALDMDPKFRDPAAFELVKDFVVLLPEVIGPERLNQPVTYPVLVQITLEFMAVLAKDARCPHDLRDFAEWFLPTATEATKDTDQFLANLKVTEEQFILGENLGLTEPLKALYRDGKLTLMELIRQQPGIFMPYRR